MKNIYFFIIIFFVFESCGECPCHAPNLNEHYLSFEVKNIAGINVLGNLLGTEVKFLYENDEGEYEVFKTWQVDKELIEEQALITSYFSNCKRRSQKFQLQIGSETFKGRIYHKPFYPRFSCCYDSCENGIIYQFQFQGKIRRASIYPGNQLNINVVI